MVRIRVGVVGLLSGGLLVAPVYAEQPQSPPTPPPSGKQAQSSVPQSGIIRPTPQTGDGKTLTPPNVDPGMAIAPPGTPGNKSDVVPK